VKGLGALVGLFALLALSSDSKQQGHGQGAPPGGASGSGREVTRLRTGDATESAWRQIRLPILVGTLSELGDLAGRVALSILAQWAHETNRGTHEFNYNLGGWHARRGEDYFTARDVQEGPALVHWSAYTDLPVAIRDQVRRLKAGFPSAWSLLVGSPESSAWVERLGKLGYYSSSPAAYATAWAMHRAELGAMS
jgi:hypothetical protein